MPMSMPVGIPLVKATSDIGFTINEVSADKAYSAKDNFNIVHELGGVAYIPFRGNATGKSDRTKGSRGKIWRRMFHYFQLNQEEFAQHYHKRSNVETTFFMIKAKFNDVLKSKTRTAQINELLLKVLCHNIVVVNNEIRGQGINV
jgi:transposase